MKLKTIASAVSVSLAALALTACGGSDNSAPVSNPAPTTPTNPSTDNNANNGNNNPNNNTGAVVETSNANSNVVTTANTTINNINTDKTPVVHTHQYLRAAQSNFDRVANPTSENTADWGASTDLEPNTNLSNFVVGTEGTRDADGKLIRWGTDYLGEYTNKSGQKEALSKANSKYVTVTNFNVVDLNGNVYNSGSQDYSNVGSRKTIQEQNAVDVAPVDGALLSNDTNVANRLVATLATATATSGERTGLVGHVVSPDGTATVNYGRKEVIERGITTMDNANDQATRVYGRNYRDVKIAGVAQDANSYVANYDENGVFTGGSTLTLNNTQYGRLTARVDAMSGDPSSEAGENTIAYREFVARNSDYLVDFYFHRGIGATTVAQMDALKAAGGTFNYKGHALTYGVEPIVTNANGSNSTPTAFGSTQQGRTFGDFVEATYDVAKGTVTGNVYNFYNSNVSDTASQYKKQDLISFNGEVHGNTVIGSATKLQGNETGSLLANFYGDKAQELGGNINSITKDVGYGEAKWGAVFGAQRINAPTPVSGFNFNTGAFNGGN